MLARREDFLFFSLCWSSGCQLLGRELVNHDDREAGLQSVVMTNRLATASIEGLKTLGKGTLAPLHRLVEALGIVLRREAAVFLA